MSEALPDCGHRGNVLHVIQECYCRNELVAGAMPSLRVPFARCLNCPIEVREMPIRATSVVVMPRATPPQTEALPCIHRSEEPVDRVSCSCSAGTSMSVFRCTIKGECLLTFENYTHQNLRRDGTGERRIRACCEGCKDREPLPV